MVFESVVADLLNRFLGDFVDNLDASQLNIGIWGGMSSCLNQNETPNHFCAIVVCFHPRIVEHLELYSCQLGNSLLQIVSVGSHLKKAYRSYLGFL